MKELDDFLWDNEDLVISIKKHYELTDYQAVDLSLKIQLNQNLSQLLKILNEKLKP